MLVTYFVTSADSATLVICTLICMGDEHPPARYRIFWGLAIGAVAAVLLLAGGLKALQTASIVAALPFSFVTILATYGFFKSLRQDVAQSDAAARRELSDSQQAPVTHKPTVTAAAIL
jgi:choline/glycine/proline betaine transport protein